MSDEYKPVPLQEAKRIAKSYSKDLVVILAYDAVKDMIASATWGGDAARRIADTCLQAIGVDAPGELDEDEREHTRLRRRIDELEGYLAEIRGIVG